MSQAVDNAPTRPLYLDPSASIEARVEDLLGRMTPAEKIAQLSSLWIPGTSPEKPIESILTEEWLEKSIPHGVGTLTPFDFSIATELPLRNLVRRFLRTRTRLGIPAFFHDEACHGLMKPEATSFPVPIGFACSWNEELVEKLCAVAAREAHVRGTHHLLTPVVDVCLDPRWGRTDETLGEDPWLNAKLGAAMIRGFQGSSDGTIAKGHVMATLKHLVGHGAPEGGLNRSPAHVGPIELRETHLRPFELIIRDAKPAAVMPSYNEIDAVPAHGNKPLLQGILRSEWGFTGLIISDYFAVTELWQNQRVVPDSVAAARLALETGVQMELPWPEAFPKLEPLLATDAALSSLVEDAVRAVLAWKFRLGLFEEGPLDTACADAVVRLESSRDLALQAARESIVLLRNEGNLLPLLDQQLKTVAVIGPNADIARLGSYSGRPLKPISPLEGICERLKGKAEVLHAEGCKIANQDARDANVNWRSIVDVRPADPAIDAKLIDEAVALAERSDLVVLTVGENEVVSRESWETNKLGDRPSLELIGAQGELARRLLDTGKPVILVLINGRPIALGDLKNRFPAIVEAWYPGQEGGRALAEILFGDVTPSGKLTISFPRSAGHLPAHYRRKPNAARFTYLFDTHEADFPFGFGLSYTKFEYGTPEVDRNSVDANGSVSVSITVTNTGTRAGTEIVQLYLQDEIASVTRPVRELRGFRRLALQPGETQVATFSLGWEELSMVNASLKRVVEPGWFTAHVGASSAATQAVRFEVR